MSPHEQKKGSDHEHSSDRVVFFVDKQKFTADREKLTPRFILTQLVKEDPAVTVLVLVEGTKTTKLTDLDTPIEMKNGMHFTLFHTGPTTVS
jgi:hypothetical protein